MKVVRHPGFILPVVLVLIGLLAVTLASFMFFVNAEVAGIQAHRDAQQARLAAESGLEEVITILRASPDDPSAWFDVPDRFRNALVWAETYTRQEDPVAKMGSRKEILALAAPPVAWRYSVVAENLDGLPQTFRFGVTPEAGKLNLNTASDEEIERLLTPLLMELQVENAPELVAALLDWRDEDEDVRPGGAENEYYTNLQPAYTTKNGRLDTLEELLEVKGWTAAMLYGEDTNRNGLLDANEDDADASFPAYDNADGLLNRGIAPYVTVWSREPGLPSQGQTPGPGGESEQEQTPEPEQAAGSEEQPQPTPLPQGQPPAEQQPSKGQTPPPVKGGARRSDKAPGDKPPDKPPAGRTTGPGLSPLPGGPPAAPSSGAPPQGATSQPTQAAMREGLVNVNTAPLRVLQALDGMPPGAAEAIVALRQELTPEALKSSEWLVTSGAIDPATYAQIKDRITTRALQFHVEILGYGDHTKLARRYEWIIEMRGSVAQVLYHRDLTGLGFAWPIDDETLVVKGR